MDLRARWTAAAATAAVAAAGLLLVAIGSGSAAERVPTAAPAIRPADPGGQPTLAKDCADLAAYLRPQGEESASRPWSSTGPSRTIDLFRPVAAALGTGTTLTSADKSGKTGQASTVTKVVGDRVLTLAGGWLRILGTAGGKLTELGSLALTGDELLLLPRERVLVTGTREAWGPNADRTESAVVTLIDVSEPTAPTVLRSEEITGETLVAHEHDGVVRVVITSPPGVAYSPPAPDETGEQARERNLAAVRHASGEDWLPRRSVFDSTGKLVSSGPLMNCDRVLLPPGGGTFGFASVLTIDTTSDREHESDGATGLATGGGAAYVSDTRVWLTTPGPREGAEGGKIVQVSSLHAFDGTRRDASPYLATGPINGAVHGPEAFSEKAGLLRVVTGTRTSEGSHGGTIANRLGVAVFREDGSVLDRIGELRGIRPGKSDRNIRWAGDLAFANVNEGGAKLFVLDVSDPTAPCLAGTPTLPGWIGHLEPVGGDRAVGVGPFPDNSHFPVTVSAFDFADPAKPDRTGSVNGGKGAPTYSPGAFGWLLGLGIAVVGAQDMRDERYFTVVARLDSRGKLRTLGRLDIDESVSAVAEIGKRILLITESSVHLIDPTNLRILDTL